MAHVQIIGDLEDDPDGNYWHIVVEGHGVTQEEVAEVLQQGDWDALSRSSQRPMTFGWTSAGKYLAVVWEHVLDDPLTIYPVTAYPANPPGRRKKR